MWRASSSQASKRVPPQRRPLTPAHPAAAEPTRPQHTRRSTRRPSPCPRLPPGLPRRQAHDGPLASPRVLVLDRRTASWSRSRQPPAANAASCHLSPASSPSAAAIPVLPPPPSGKGPRATTRLARSSLSVSCHASRRAMPVKAHARSATRPARWSDPSLSGPRIPASLQN